MRRGDARDDGAGLVAVVLERLPRRGVEAQELVAVEQELNGVVAMGVGAEDVLVVLLGRAVDARPSMVAAK